MDSTKGKIHAGKTFGPYENYDALILDGVCAIRLLDAVERRSSKWSQRQYFIAAAVCEYPVVLIGLDHPVSEECWTPIVSGSSFLALHPHVYHLYETLIDCVLGGHRFA